MTVSEQSIWSDRQGVVLFGWIVSPIRYKTCGGRQTEVTYLRKIRDAGAGMFGLAY
jgi:hypothetical protein